MTRHSAGHHPQCWLHKYAAVSMFGVAEVRQFAAWRRVNPSHVPASLSTFSQESF
jgi:hypothetical protein